MTIEINPGPAYVSFSSLTSWMKCGKQYELRKIAGVEEQPSWALVGGSAVHAATEELDRDRYERTGT